MADPSEHDCKCFSADPKANPTKKRRNLVVCIDGTSNRFGVYNTNVVALYRELTKDGSQLTYYNSGVGTFANMANRSLSYWWAVVDSWLDMAFARNVDKIIIDAYRWLAENYEEGDVIYFFGFSRGAYQVRALAGMIEKVGLIYRGNNAQIPFAYELYSSDNKADTTQNAVQPSVVVSDCIFVLMIVAFLAFLVCSTMYLAFLPGLWRARRIFEGLLVVIFLWIAVVTCTVIFLAAVFMSPKLRNTLVQKKTTICTVEEMAEEFKYSFSHRNVRVHFVGCWDTVSSIGLHRRTLPLADSMKHVCFFRHALALDERRVKFMPEYVKPHGPPKNERKTAFVPPAELSKGSRSQVLPHIKEVWFPGTHSDVGGRNPIKADRKSDQKYGNPSLWWMVQHARGCGLRIEMAGWSGFDWPRDRRVVIRESLTLGWTFLEYVPVYRLDLSSENPAFTRLPNFGNGRIIRKGQTVHFSAAFREPTQAPEAMPLVPRAGAKQKNIDSSHVPEDRLIQWMAHWTSDSSENRVMKWIAQWPREGIEFDSQADVEGLIKGEPKNPEPSPWETRVLVIEAILSDLPRIVFYSKIWLGAVKFFFNIATIALEELTKEKPKQSEDMSKVGKEKPRKGDGGEQTNRDGEADRTNQTAGSNSASAKASTSTR